MHSNLQRGVVFALVALFAATGVFAEHHETKVPTSGFRAEYPMDMGNLEKKVLGLADAVPADKYSWAPTSHETAGPIC